MTSSDGQASSVELEKCLRCKKPVKDKESGLECDLCHYWFHIKCEGVGADMYKAMQKFEEAVKTGKTQSAVKWFCDCCARTVDKIICRLDELAKDQARMTELIDNLKQKQMELEKGLAGVGEVVRSDDKSSAVVSNKSMALPVRQEINEALDMEKRKDMIVVRGIREDEDAEKRVEAIMQELGHKRQYQVLGRIGKLRKDVAGEERGAVGVRCRLVSVKLGSVGDKWRIVSEARKLSKSADMKDIFISPDLTRKQAEEDRELRTKLKEIRLSGEFNDGVEIHKGKIVRVADGHVVHDPSA